MNDLNLIRIQSHNNISLFVIVKIIRSNKINPLKNQNLNYNKTQFCIIPVSLVRFILYIDSIYSEKSKFTVKTIKHKN